MAPSNVKATAVILGGTGDLGVWVPFSPTLYGLAHISWGTPGIHLSKIFLTEYRTTFSTVRVTTRTADSSKAQELAKLGAELHPHAPTALDAVLSGADVVVNALSADVQNAYNDTLAAALARHDVKVYFLGEFGV